MVKEIIKMICLDNKNVMGKITQIVTWMNDDGIFIGTHIYYHDNHAMFFIENRVNDKLPLVKCPIYPCILIMNGIVNDKLHFDCGNGLLHTCVWNT